MSELSEMNTLTYKKIADCDRVPLKTSLKMKTTSFKNKYSVRADEILCPARYLPLETLIISSHPNLLLGSLVTMSADISSINII